MNKAQTHQTVVHVNDEWETPPHVLAQAMQKYNVSPQLDVCATAANAKCPKYFTVKENALQQEWTEDFFMNPPYSEVTEWLAKAYEQSKKHNVTALILVFAKTSVKWWHKYVEGKAETHFHQGRIRFLINGVKPRYCKKCKLRFAEVIQFCKVCAQRIYYSSPTYDSVWIVYRSI